MKTKLLIIMTAALLLGSCYHKDINNIPSEYPVRRNNIRGVIVDGHDYIMISNEYTHSGLCRKCKQERDSIVSIIIKAIKENDN